MVQSPRRRRDFSQAICTRTYVAMRNMIHSIAGEWRRVPGCQWTSSANFPRKRSCFIPWGSVGADYVCESTGVFCDKAHCQLMIALKKNPKHILHAAILIYPSYRRRRRSIFKVGARRLSSRPLRRTCYSLLRLCPGTCMILGKLSSAAGQHANVRYGREP